MKKKVSYFALKNLYTEVEEDMKGKATTALTFTGEMNHELSLRSPLISQIPDFCLLECFKLGGNV